MWRDPKLEREGLLVYRTEDFPGAPLLGVALLAGGAVLLYCGITVDFAHARVQGDGTFEHVMTLCVGGGLLLGGLFNSCRFGLTFDRGRREIVRWTYFGPVRTQSARSLAGFDRVVIRRGTDAHSTRRMSPDVTYPLSIETPDGRSIPVATLYDDERAYQLATEIATHLSMTVEDHDDRKPPPRPVVTAVADVTNEQFNRALGIFQEFGPRRLIPVEKRWAEELPGVAPSEYAALSARCKSVEDAAGEIAEGVVQRGADQNDARAAFVARFPELDEERVSRTWSQALYYASR